MLSNRFTLLPLMVLVSMSCTRQSSSPLAVDPSAAQLFQKKNIGRFGLRGQMKVALTYDDGPMPPATSDLLDYLASQKIKATFFIIGQHAERYPDLMARISREGHVLGNHTEHHVAFNKAVYAAQPQLAVNEVLDADKAIRPYVADTQRHLYFRAPEGAWKFSLADLMNAVTDLRPYVGPVFWDEGGELQPAPKRGQPYSVTADTIQSSADWNCWAHHVDVATCAAGYLKEIDANKGGVVLMHTVDDRSSQMSKIIIPALQQQGYEFVTLDQVPNLDQYEYADVFANVQ